MWPWRELKHGVRALMNRGSTDIEIADEVQHYLEQATAAHEARGLSRGAAQRAAAMELGGAMQVRETVRSHGWENVVETVLSDLRHAARRLRSTPGFTAIALVTLALGVGGTTAIFSAVNPILLESLPYPDADRIVVMQEVRGDGSRSDATFGMNHFLAGRLPSFSSTALYKPWQPTMTGASVPERFDGQRVSASYFDVLGIKPVLGRAFEADEDRSRGASVVVLSDRLWRRRFAADRSIIGRDIKLNDRSFTVIGVMPAKFENVVAPAAELWSPLQYDVSEGRAWGHHLTMLGRLRAGASATDAGRELNAAAHAILAEQKPDTYRADDVNWITPTLQADLTRGVKPALLAIMGAVMLVLVIACVNVTNLLLARGAQRRGEFALRAALGAGRRRLIRQLLTESMLLATLGGIAGMLLAVLGVRALAALTPAELPRAGGIHLDAPVFLFGLGVTTLIGIAFGLIPALQASGSEHHNLQSVSRRTVGEHRRTRSALVVAEVALALVLLVGSGLLLRSISRLLAVSPGFNAEGVLTMQVQISTVRYSDSTRYAFFDRALEAVRHVPGVTRAAMTSQLPLSGDLEQYGVHFEAGSAQTAAEDHSALRYGISPGYIETMGIPIRRGRSLDERDRADTELAVLLGESFAARIFPGIDPIGRKLRIGPTDGPPLTIVGVVGDVTQQSLALGVADAVYTAGAQWQSDNVMSLVVRTRGDPRELIPALRAAVWSVDRDQPVVRVAMMDDLLSASASQRRFALVLFEAFALAALALAAAGIYGVISGSVAERTREIGVRAALGASRSDILSLVLTQGARLTGWGVAAGLAAAAVASRAITSLLFGVSRLDPLTYAGVITLLVTVSLFACAIPAWRAARVDPARTLRE